jgi:hypothetical protein
MISISKLNEQYEPLSVKWNRKCNHMSELKNRKYRICNLKKWNQTTDRIIDEMKKNGGVDFSKLPDMPNYAGSLLLKNEVEIALIETEIDEIEKKNSRLWQHMESLFSINRSNTKFKKISKKEQRKLERDTCAICYEEHNISQIITIGSCGHSFGKSCFKNVITHYYDNDKEITCPYCRNQTIDMIRYRK